MLFINKLCYLVTGLVHDFRFDWFVVGPLGIKSKNDIRKVYFNKNTGYYEGVAGPSPKETHPDNA